MSFLLSSVDQKVPLGVTAPRGPWGHLESQDPEERKVLWVTPVSKAELDRRGVWVPR